MKTWVLCLLPLLLFGCAPPSPPPLTVAEVQDFVRQYVAAANAGDASKLMELISREPSVSSVGYGKIERGWDAIRASTDANVAEATRVRITLGTVEVTGLGTDFALAVAPMYITPLQSRRAVDVPGGLTILVKRTPEGLRLIHQHYSVRAS